MAFSVTLGPPPLGVWLGALAELSLDLELDSCEKAHAAANSTAHPRRMPRPPILDFSKFTSILCRAQYRRQVLREARARQNFIAPCRLRLSSKLGLHVRKKPDHANVLLRLPQLFNRLERLVPRIQVHDDEFWLTQHESLQRLAACRNLHLHPKLFGGFRQLHLEEQIVHQRHNSSHFAPPLSIPLKSPLRHYAPLLPKRACSPVRCAFALKR